MQYNIIYYYIIFYYILLYYNIRAPQGAIGSKPIFLYKCVALLGLLWCCCGPQRWGQLGLLLSSVGLPWGCCRVAGDGQNHLPAKSPFGLGWKLHKAPAPRAVLPRMARLASSRTPSKKMLDAALRDAAFLCTLSMLQTSPGQRPMSVAVDRPMIPFLGSLPPHTTVWGRAYAAGMPRTAQGQPHL